VLPETGQIVRVRARQYLVEKVTPTDARGQQTCVALSCLDDDAQGDTLEVLWELEPDARVLGSASWEAVQRKGFDAPWRFAAYLHAQWWNCVTSTDPRLFQAPHRAGIKIDPSSGEMTVAFVVDDTTTTFQPVIGPKDRRLLLLTNMKQNVAKEPIKLALFSENYKEQLTWRDAATGKIIAESDFLDPLTINSLTTPGFGGRVYFPSTVGKGFYVLQAMPKAAAK
jgi:hypothetical protein